MPERLTSTLLTPAGLLYGLVMTARNALYDWGIFKAWRSPIPVVSVGNITTGGTGKTPLVDWIVKFYKASGKKAAIISRGYGRQTTGPMVVSDGRRILLGSRDAGDETAMLASRNPSSIVIVAEKRQAGVELLMRVFAGSMPDVIVLDDAFQHRSIARDLDILVINATEPFSRARVLPAGRLREPLTGVRRADIFILNKITDESRAAAIVETLKPTGKPVVRARIRPGKLLPAGDEPNRPLRALAFAGIGSPEGFLHSLGEAGIKVDASRFFRDHQPYTLESVNTIVAESDRLDLTPVTTEKDWFRIRENRMLAAPLENAGCRYLPIEPDLYEGRAELERLLLALLR